MNRFILTILILCPMLVGCQSKFLTADFEGIDNSKRQRRSNHRETHLETASESNPNPRPRQLSDEDRAFIAELKKRREEERIQRDQRSLEMRTSHFREKLPKNEFCEMDLDDNGSISRFEEWNFNLKSRLSGSEEKSLFNASANGRTILKKMLRDFRREKDPRKKRDLILQLSAVGGQEVAKAFVKAFEKYKNHGIKSDDDGGNLHMLLLGLGAISGDSDEAWSIIRLHVDRESWAFATGWDIFGETIPESKIDRLRSITIQAFGMSTKPEASLILKQLVEETETLPKSIIAASIVDANFYSFMIKHVGRWEMFQSMRGLEGPMNDFFMWVETEEGKAWKAWRQKLERKANPSPIDQEIPRFKNVGDGEWSDPEYRRVLIRHLEFRSYIESEIKDDPVFQQIDQFVKHFGYDEPFVRRFYVATFFHHQDTNFFIRTAPKNIDIPQHWMDRKLKIRLDRAKKELVEQLQRSNLVTREHEFPNEMIEGIFEFKPTKVWKPDYKIGVMGGKPLIYSIEQPVVPQNLPKLIPSTL